VAAPTLQDGIDRAGSPLALLWKPGAGPWTPEVIEDEYAGWRREQQSWHSGATIMDLSHHMSDTVFEGSDVTRLLSEVSANNYEKFAVGQAKQFIPVAADGNIVTDGILLKETEERYVLSGVAAAQNWVRFHAGRSGHDVSSSTDPNSSVRGGGDPKTFRYQIQGPLARDLVERVFGGPLPEVRFFHSSILSLDGRPVRALRHGMAGQDGYEFIGAWNDAAAVKETFLRVGEEFGLVHVGAWAYPTASLESGWIPSPLPAIYTAPELAEYRQFVGLYSYEGQNALHGTYVSDRIEDYYASPYELGYGRSISLGHDFTGRDALIAAQQEPLRRKVTLVIDPADLASVPTFRDDFVLDYGRHRVEAGDDLAGMTYYAGSVDPVGSVLALALVDERFAVPGTTVTLVWGEHPGVGTPDGEVPEFTRLRATVRPAPYDEYARSRYRADA